MIAMVHKADGEIEEYEVDPRSTSPLSLTTTLSHSGARRSISVVSSAGPPWNALI